MLPPLYGTLRATAVLGISHTTSDTQEFASKAASDCAPPREAQERGISFHKLYSRPIDLEIIPAPVHTEIIFQRWRVKFISSRRRSAFKAAHLEKRQLSLSTSCMWWWRGNKLLLGPWHAKLHYSALLCCTQFPSTRPIDFPAAHIIKRARIYCKASAPVTAYMHLSHSQGSSHPPRVVNLQQPRPSIKTQLLNAQHCLDVICVRALANRGARFSIS